MKREYIGNYRVSDTGKVQSNWKRTNRGAELSNERFDINPWIKQQHGVKYSCVDFKQESKIRTRYKLGPLVAHLFLGYDFKGNIIYKDGDGTNCNVENLIISTAKGRVYKCIERGKHISCKNKS